MSPDHPSPEDRDGTNPSFGLRASEVWRAVRWPLLAAATVVTFFLGYVGFRAYFADIDVMKSPSDLAYLSLQLFALESGSVPETGAPWTLEVARLAAPVIAGIAVVVAVAVVFREQIAEWRLRWERDHVVVCGLGDAGASLASKLLDSGRRVVVIELDPSSPAVTSLRQKGAEVITGDARDPETLGRAHVDRASHLVCLSGADDTNAEIALQAADLVADREGPALICLAHIREPDLCVLMRLEELSCAHQAGSRLDFFNLDEQGARALLRDHPPFQPDDPGTVPPHILIVGLNRLGQSLVAELARQWRTHPGACGRPITITTVAPDAPAIADRLGRRYPQLGHAARLVPIEAELDPLDPGVVARSGAPGIAYVCIDDDSVALQAAIRTRHGLSDTDALVVVELPHAGGIARLIDRPDHSDRLRAFNLMDRTMRPDLLLGGTNELLAQAIHQDYLDEQRREGATVKSNPSLVPWDRLPDSLKESNRDQAAHIGTKLASLGRGIAPLTDWDADPAIFTDGQVEMLAEMEHERWVQQRRRDGWTEGPKDIATKTTPYLVPWDALDDEVKEWDRQAVRGIPTFLARAGYQVVAAGTGDREETPGRSHI